MEQGITGRITWIGVRPARREPLEPRQDVLVQAGIGLDGDHYDQTGGKRQITLIMQEDLDAAARELGRVTIDPALVRRNIVVSGVDLHRFREGYLRVGSSLVEVTGECHPCERMNENLGEGGRQSLASRGGITGRILEGGTLRIGDEVKWA
ncbi:MAG: MOSC domain-containing protein [Lewinellaceae bacterium]|nr:MOSC domain-containing protein [Saprospiraceae bacterium]MCB9311773.1 MOSC domain-containing protein [Lewinellaceae bacterium]